ncbi:Gfo/Idh/MocA family protein [Alkalihalobacillus sp. 1P02AB]|uniref:Gfo/Idh/MocA family protein n=1 Tax=Alkalihalobacillus sp. 1P02AB TaxID=3132260 RepID=UPI0039A75C2D
MKIKLGIIGCGRITEKHCQTINQIDDIEVVALSDLSDERMKIIKGLLQQDELKKIVLYKDYEKLLSHSEIDLVLIATSSGFHCEMAEKALKSNKHVLVEKPLTLSLMETKYLTKLAHKQNRKLFVCYQLRYRKLMLAVKDCIEQGLLGKVFYGVGSIQITRPQQYYQQASWRGSWQNDGGMLINQGIHVIDLLLWLIGDLERVYGELMRVNEQKETEDIALALLNFKNGAKGLIEANTVSLPDNVGYSIKLFAEKGTIIIRGKQLDHIERFEIQGKQKVDLDTFLNDRSEHIRMYEAYLKEIQTGNEPVIVDGAESEKALEAIYAIYQSALNKTEVQLPLHNFSSKEMTAWEKER